MFNAARSGDAVAVRQPQTATHWNELSNMILVIRIYLSSLSQHYRFEAYDRRGLHVIQITRTNQYVRRGSRSYAFHRSCIMIMISVPWRGREDNDAKLHQPKTLHAYKPLSPLRARMAKFVHGYSRTPRAPWRTAYSKLVWSDQRSKTGRVNRIMYSTMST